MAAIKLSKGGGRWRKDEKYPRAVHLLEKMFNIMEEASDDRRNRDHSSLREILETWEEIKDETGNHPSTFKTPWSLLTCI